MQNLELDPTTKDYVLNAQGSPIPSDRVLESVYYALTIPQNAWLYGTDNQGSKLHLLNNVKRSGSIEQQVSSYVMDAVERQVISPGFATAAAVRNLEATRTGSLNRVEVIPQQVQVSDQLNFASV
jgi:phage gp46-like protein